MIVLWA